MNIAIIDPIGSHGSSHHFYLFGQAEGLINNGVNVSLFTNSKTSNPKINGLKFYQSFGNIFMTNNKLLNGVKFVLGSFYSIFKARISAHNIIHFHVFYSNFLVLLNILLSKVLFSKVVLTVHDVDTFTNVKVHNYIKYLCYHYCDLILTHNEFSKQEISSFLKYKTEKIFIVPHGNYLPFINIKSNQEESREHLNLPKSSTILLFFGIIKSVKGLDVLLNAFREIIDKNPKTILLIAGRSMDNNFCFYQSIINQERLEENVIIHNKFIKNKDVPHYFCASDLVILPYKKIYQSGVLMMTLSYGKPVVVSDLPPLIDIIKHKVNGFVFKSENSVDLSIKVNDILSNMSKCLEVAQNGVNTIDREYNWSRIGKLTLEAYKFL